MVISNPSPFQSLEISSLQNKKLIAVGSYSYNKGYDLLLQIWAQIENDFPDWELNIYGRETKINLQEIAEKQHLKNIHFHEPVTDIGAKYLDSSIMVLPSRSEGFGMVLIEAMIFGLPVVSFDCPNGPKDIISDTEDGFLIENGNIYKFAEKLTSLMLHEDLRQKMGNIGRHNVQRFSASTILRQWDILFKSL